MRKLIGVLLVILIVTLTGCKKEVTYVFIDHSIDGYIMDMVILDETYELTGEIQYHVKYDAEELYLNVFGNADNLSAGDLIAFEYIKIDGEDVSFSFEGVDHNQVLLNLNEDIVTGDEINITYKITGVYRDQGRFSYSDSDEIYNMFFYPYVALKDENGLQIEQYTFRGETYYNDLGNYLVTITCDKDFIIAAPGILDSSVIEENKKTETYRLEKARDFSFSLSEDYYMYQRVVDDITYDIYSLIALDTTTKNFVFKVLEDSFKLYETSIGEYYYDRFVLELGNIYGMESSGIIYCSTDISEGTIVHEVLHQWFYVMIGNDQYNESFIDESLTTFATSLYFKEVYGNEAYIEYTNERSSFNPRLSEYVLIYMGQSLNRNVHEIGDGYAYLIYYHGPAIYKQFIDEFLNGDTDKFLEIMSAYYDEFNGKNVSLSEYVLFLETETQIEGLDEWFLLHINEMQDITNKPESMTD